MNRLPQDSSKIGSFAECRAAFDECRKRYRTRENRETQTEVKTLRRNMVRMTKKQHANEKLKSCGAWSGAAIGCVTLLWTAFEEYGYPGPKWLFENEFVYGGVCWAVTLMFGWAAKAFHTAEQ